MAESSYSPYRSRWWRRIAVLAAAVATVVPVACTASGTPTVTVIETVPTGDSVIPGTTAATTPTATGTLTSTPPAPAVRVSAAPAFGSTDLAPTAPITITAFNSSLVDVRFTGDDGEVVAGEMSDDGHGWSRTDRLAYGVTYTVTVTAEGADGTRQSFDGTFATVDPEDTMAAAIQVPDGATVGIATPIVVTFAGSVADRAAAERTLHVTTTDANGDPIDVEGSWGWMQDEDIQGDGVLRSRAHFRTAEYWPAGTHVHVDADLYGVDYGTGWGAADIARDFTIGPKLIIQADVDSHRLLVVENDEIVKNYPVSYGIPASVDEGRATVSGIHIVQDKETDNPDGSFTMCNKKYGYCDITEYWGIRINNNGEFIHVNPATEKAGLLGKANVSHGCINIGMRDGKELFDMVYYGIPVDIEGTGVEMGYGDYVWDWSVSYDTWQTFSAL